MTRLATVLVGVALILLGLAFIPLPIPLGAVLVLAGTALLISSSNTFARFIRFIRSNSAFLDAFFDKIASVLPDSLSQLLRRTEP